MGEREREQARTNEHERTDEHICSDGDVCIRYRGVMGGWEGGSQRWDVNGIGWGWDYCDNMSGK